MQKIIYPLQDGDKGAEVQNLHDAMMELGQKMKIPGFLESLNAPEFVSTFFQERREERFGQATRQVVSAFQVLYMKVTPTGVVDEETAGVLNGLLEKYGLIPPAKAPAVVYKITGSVYDEWIEPMTGATVKAFGQGLRSEVELGSAVTDGEGKYAIHYGAAGVVSGNGEAVAGATVGAGSGLTGSAVSGGATGAVTGATDVVLRLYGSNGALLYTSPVYYDAGAELEADIDLGPYPYRGDSEFTAVVKKITPFLGGLTIDQLNENSNVHDLTYLIGKTGISVDVLLTLVAGYRFGKLTGVDSGVLYGILREVGDFSAALPDDVDAGLQQVYVDLWSNPVATMMAAFGEAADSNIIPYKLWADQANVQAQLQRLKQAPPAAGTAVSLPAIYQQVGLAELNAQQSLTVLELFQASAVDDDFWSGLAGNAVFQGDGAAGLNKLKVVLQLSDWTMGNTGVVSSIMQQHKITGPDDLRSLVAYNTNDWVSILNAMGAGTGGGAGVGGDVPTMAATIAAGIEALYPTPVFAARFGKAENLPLNHKDYFTGILNAGDFDIMKTSVPSYLSSYAQKNPLPEGADVDTVTHKLMGLQRVYKTVGSADTSLALLSTNIQSARQVYAMGKSGFVAQYQQVLGGTDKAEAVFEQAATAHAGAAYLTGKMVSTLNNPATNLLPDYSGQLKNGQFAKDHPNLAKLFGVAASYCECKDCHSFLSLAAYLTDLLDFLYERKLAGAPNNARAVLLANNYVFHGNHWRRRPDLGDIDLTCENTNTELPYIDIVNELLEDYIVPPIAAIVLKLNGNDPKGPYHQFMAWVLTVLKAGKISQTLFDALIKISQYPRTPICNISLLTPDAVVSTVFYADNENFPAWINEQWIPQWVIRDRYITLKIALAISPSTLDLLPKIFDKDLIVLDVDSGLEIPDNGTGILGNVYNEGLFASTNGERTVSGFALIVQEIHETHLSNAEITPNPEYSNTNVYESLSDPLNAAGQNKWELYPDRIPIDLPYDLYFSEVNTYLEKMGKKRWELEGLFKQETGHVAIAYMGISTGEAAIIFTARTGIQAKFWGKAIAGSSQPEVDLVLTASGLRFVQLELLLTMSFINPAGDSYIATTDNSCDTAKMIITAMTADKLDKINRFLRLWNKLKAMTAFTMKQLDDCIMSPALGNGKLDGDFAVVLYRFLRVMEMLGLNATKALVLYQDMGTAGNGNLYELLFQNRRISNPLVAAFHLPLPVGPQVTKIADTAANPGAIPVILTACGISQEDLTVILGRDNGAYADLSVTNLSFIYACGLVCQALRCTADQLFTFAALVGVNPLRKVLSGQPDATPDSTLQFIEAYRAVQNAGLSVDEMNYLLTNQSTDVPSLIPDADTVVAGLADIREAVQAAVIATTPVDDPKGMLLQKWLADPVLGWDKAISSKLLGILAAIRNGDAGQVQENVRFLQLLQTRYTMAVATAYLDRLPAISLPDNTITGMHYDTTQYYLFYNGTMSDDFRQFLMGLASDAVSQSAVASLYTQSQDCVQAAVVLPGAVPASPPAWVGQGQQNISAFSGGTGALGFTGPMSAAVYLALLGQSTDPGYAAALGQLFLSTQGSAGAVYVRLAVLPPIALPDKNAGSLSYDATAQVLSFSGVMSLADLRCLLAISSDLSFQAAIGQLYVESQGAQVSSVSLAMLPVGWSALPDLSVLPGLTAAAGQLTFTGQMNPAVLSGLLALSPDAAWQAAIQALNTASQLAPVSSVAGVLPVIALPLPDAALTTAGYVPGAIVFDGAPNAKCMDEFNLEQLNPDDPFIDAISFIYSGVSAGCAGIVVDGLPPIGLPSGMAIAWAAGQLSFTGQMQAAELAQLQQLSPDAAYQAAIGQLLANSKVNTVCTTALAALPPVAIPSGSGFQFDVRTNVLYYNGGLPIPAPSIAALRPLSAAVDFQAALDVLAGAAASGGTYAIFAPAPLTPFNSVTLAAGSISYQGGQLTIVSPMTFEDCAGLLSLSGDPNYQQAVMDLYLGVAAVLPIGLPAIGIPAMYAGQLSYDAGSSELVLKGVIGNADRLALLSLGRSYGWQQAIESIFSVASGNGYSFTDIYPTIMDVANAAGLYNWFLAAIAPVYRPLMEAEALAEKIAGNLEVSVPVATALVSGLPDLFAVMTDPLFAANNRAINPDPLQSVQALWYMKLARIAFLVEAYTISAADVGWLLVNASAFQALALDAYPSSSASLPFSQWKVFDRMRSFQQRYMPVDSISVYSILSEAHSPGNPPNPGKLLDQVIRLTGWDRVELNGLVTNLTDLADIGVLQWLSEVFTAAAQLKVVPSRIKGWVADPVTNTVAVDIKQALRALYADDQSWTTAIVPLMNSLRMERRDAVLSYLLSNSVRNPFSYGNPGDLFDFFPDEFAVYGNFLIDAEMAACQPTTRIIQGYCSIQLFVQRCLMNSESPMITVNTDPFTGDPDWRQWDWMGTAESWYEARYAFLFPENLILPQTLPGQSPFFHDLQRDLTQGPVTLDIVTTAFSNYIESLDEVARLQIKGTWYDEPSGTLYVFGRTYSGTSPAYYFRSLAAGGRWGAWEAVTADVAGDTIIPVVQNGRLYLYWPVFTAATDEDKKTQTQHAKGGAKGDISTSTPPPPKYWQVQLAFSEYRNGKWSGKSLSTDYLVCPQVPTSGSHYPPYPDVKDFIFFALDIPVANSNPFQGTVEAVRTNNEMVIACFLNGALTMTVSIDLYWPHGGLGDTGVLFTLEMDLQNFSFSTRELLHQITDHLIGEHVLPPFPFNLGSSTIDLFSGNVAATLEQELNNALGLIQISAQVNWVRFTNVGSDTLNALRQDASNAFLLDAARGFPTPVNLSNFANYDTTIGDLWFDGSNFDSMLLVGRDPLEDNKGHKILSTPTGGSANYRNLVSLQMGIWAKFAYLTGNKLQFRFLGNLMPFFYQDKTRTFLVNQAITLSGKKLDYPALVAKFFTTNGNPALLNQFFSASDKLTPENGPAYQFLNYYHPFAQYFLKALVQQDLTAVLARPIQLTGDDQYGGLAEVRQNFIHSAGYKDFSFQNNYTPAGTVKDLNQSGIEKGYPLEQMDFDLRSGYGQYNWELFFHGVLLSCMQLTQNQQFEAADNFIKSILDLTDGSAHKAPQKYWVTKPFFEHTGTQLSLDEQVLLYELDPASQKAFWASVEAWRNDPYDPHRLAQLRITPYMYATFMRWMDNRIAWADHNYTQYTMESVNIAIQLYMSVLEALGPKPQAIPPITKLPVCNYYQVELNLEVQMNAQGPNGYLSDPIVLAENLLPPAPGGGGGSKGGGKKIQMVPGLYFCVPPNELLLSYWVKVEMQLNKIRNCMNIKGQFQPLSPFPNIPGLFGGDGSGIGDFGGVLPPRRFSVLLQKATELCNEVKGLGASLLAALEKQDAEGLALLHSTQDVALQKSIDKIKQLQITDAELGLQNLEDYKTVLQDKISYYSGLVQNGGLIALERQELEGAQQSLSYQDSIQNATQIANALKQLPNGTLGINGAFGSPCATVTIGGATVGAAADSVVSYLSFLSLFAGKTGELARVNAGYSRRLAEWNFQLQLAKDELAQTETQIQAAQNKIAIANQEEANQQLIIDNAERVDAFLRNKYSNQQLYSWMVSKLSAIYFQSYQLAYAMAKQAEVCFGYELGITGSSYIQYGYWDSLHKGLLSGEALMASLRQMESDYLNLDVREYELTRSISLAQLDPVSLLQLKSKKSCYVNIPEELFDLDYPGQYFRRIKHVSVTLPGVVGAYTPVCLKMTLLGNSVRVDPAAGAANKYPRNRNASGAPTTDKRFLDNVAAVQYIATSTGVNDNGLFEVNLHDERYLPFERAGAISTWQIELPSVYSQFDPESITDLILHFSYTARDGGPGLQASASESLKKKLAAVMSAPDMVLMRSFSARRDFPTQWYKFLHPANPADPQELDMDITRRLPYFTEGHTVKITGVAVLADVPAGGSLAQLYLTGTKLKNQPVALGSNSDFGSMLYWTLACRESLGLWKVTTAAGGPAITDADVEDLTVVFYYSMA